MNADDLTKILDELGQRLGPTGEHVFQLAVRQVYIGGAIGIVLLVVGIIAAHRIIKWARAGYIREEKATIYGNSVGYMMGGALGVLACLTMVVFGAWMAIGLLNPEYAAIQSLIGGLVR